MKINLLRGKIKGLENTTYNIKKSIKTVKHELTHKKKDEYKEWNIYMKECKVVNSFYSLFFHSNKEYKERKDTYLNKLVKEKKNDLREKIIKLLKMIPGLDAINRNDTPYPLKRNFQNTNGIESFNSRFRPILDMLRVLRNGPYSRTLFQLFRQYINTTTPAKPTRSNCSPIECYGYNLKGKSTVELIVDGLPLGPQKGLILPNLIPKLLARKSKKVKVFS